MGIAVVTGSAGLIGSEAARYFAGRSLNVVGVDNDLRKYFFGAEASTAWNRKILAKEVKGYTHHDLDIRDLKGLEKVFKKYTTDIKLIIHAAAQPSHDWAAREPLTDFGVNATATLNLLELTRRHCPKAVFIFTSTNKVYGDTPNTFPFKETSTRWELSKTHRYYNGIDETMTIDASTHSLFGASKAA